MKTIIILFILFNIPAYAKDPNHVVEIDLKQACEEESLTHQSNQDPAPLSYNDLHVKLKQVRNQNRKEAACKAIQELADQGVAPIVIASTDDEGVNWKFQFNVGTGMENLPKREVVIQEIESIDGAQNSFDLSIEKSRKVTTLTITHPKFLTFLQTSEEFTRKEMDRKIGSEKNFGKAQGYYQVFAGQKQKKREIQLHSLGSPFDPEHVYHQASLSVSINLRSAKSP